MPKVLAKPVSARTRALRLLAEKHSSTELVTPCRLFLVLIVSSIMIAGISFSVVPEDFKDRSWNEVINLSHHPYTFNYEMALKEREYNLEYYERPQHNWKVDRRSGLSVDEFFDTYDAKWPVVLMDVVKKWPAMNWTKEIFLQKYGKERVMMKAVVGGLQHATGHALPLEVFIDHLNEASFDTWTYLEDELFLVMRPELKKDIGQNDYGEENFFNLFPESIRPWDCMMLWGTAHSRSTLHMDPYNWTGISAVLQGHKKWKLVPPGQDHLLYVEPDVLCGFPLECRKYNSPIDAFDADTKKYPRFKRVQYLEVDVFPGEMLIIPTGWYHQAFNVEQTMALSLQMMNRNNYLVILEEIIKAGNLKRKKLPAYFSTLLPPDQVKVFMSLLPKKLLRRGEEVTKSIQEQMRKTKDRQDKIKSGLEDNSENITILV
ncbi:uncharacterized protein LOC132553554 [Ylistrum balloti]|uniref:uncharacterized protein LOC132553554 n=1 Tax=Ylistrum balloti TaxID=509963 RepID=UPI002905A9B4|nr:uncharacterized protein LOC132553554 [Ylistrum balloti]